MREVLIPRCSQFQRFLLPNKGQAARSKAHCGLTMPDAALPMDCPDAPRSTIPFLPTRFALDRLDRPHRRDLSTSRCYSFGANRTFAAKNRTIRHTAD